jgi:hypothetical protein
MAARDRNGRAIGGSSLLDLLELGWRRDLADGTIATGLDVDEELLRAAVLALGEQARLLTAGGVAGRWPACVVVALARVAAASDGSFWPAWHRMTKARMTGRSADQWGQSFRSALGAVEVTLGVTLPDLAGARPRDALHAYLAAAAAAGGDGGEGAGTAAEPQAIRLDPFGAGVLLIAQERPALPEEVADPGDPLLVFDGDGELAGPVLPADVVWALYPADMELRSDAWPRVIVTGRPPLTWRGWRLVQLDLHGVSWLGLDEQARRVVRDRTKPVLRTGSPVAGVTMGGRPVYAAPPDVLLPPGPGRWRVEARRAGSGAVLATRTASGDSWRPDALWAKVPRPLLGELIVIATAVEQDAQPGLRRSVVVAEALAITAHPAPRLVSGGGLEPAEAVISAPPGMTVSPSALTYDEGTATREIACVAGPVLQRLAITPARLRMRIDPEPGSGAGPTPWHDAGPLRLAPADLWRGGALRLDLPGVPTLPPVLVIARDRGGRKVPALPERGAAPGQPETEPAQVLEPTRRGRYPLRRILDTVTASGDLDLAITVGGRTVTIATVTGAKATADPWAMG